MNRCERIASGAVVAVLIFPLAFSLAYMTTGVVVRVIVALGWLDVTPEPFTTWAALFSAGACTLGCGMYVASRPKCLGEDLDKAGEDR